MSRSRNNVTVQPPFYVCAAVLLRLSFSAKEHGSQPCPEHFSNSCFPGGKFKCYVGTAVKCARKTEGADRL